MNNKEIETKLTLILSAKELNWLKIAVAEAIYRADKKRSSRDFKAYNDLFTKLQNPIHQNHAYDSEGVIIE